MKYQRIAAGNHSFRRDGKLITVQQGEIVEATKAELGSEVKNYQPYKGQWGRTKMEQETNRFVHILKPRSVWLNPDQQGQYGPLVLPKIVGDLEQALFQKEDTGLTTGQPGELARKKSALKQAWTDWKYVCACDPLKKLNEKEPVDQYLTKISENQARVWIVEEEIREIRKRIKAAKKPVETEENDKIRRLRYKGTYRCNEDRQIIECDGRKTIQNADDIAIFKDDRTFVHEYLLECKKRKKERALARQEAQKQEARKRTRSVRA